MTGDQPRRVRHDLAETDLKELAGLLKEVPTETRVHRLWASDQGKTFVQRVREFRDSGVPVRWMARDLEVDERILLQVIDDHIKREGRAQRRNRPGPPRSIFGRGRETGGR